MVKNALTALLVLAAFTRLAAQTTTLNANNVKAVIGANGTLFQGGLEIPKGQGVNSIGVSQIWIGGKHNGNLHIAARLDDSTKQNDFWPGPLDTINGTIAADSNAWNNIYKVTADQIATHRSQWNKDGYTMPAGIKNWPGSNTTAQPFSQVLALFVDFNANRIYEPEKGEYPIIKGDEAAYFIINDAANTHFATGGTPMGIEIHGLAYQYANTAGLENTVFVELSFINRSKNNYDSVFAGIWTDFALGTPGDEFINTNSSKNAFYVYNADTFDVGGYGNYPPVQAVVFLNRPLQYTIETAKDKSPRGLPQTPQEFYNYLKRTWRDNSQLGRNSNGWLSFPAFDYIYDGDPCADSGWTEMSAAQNKGQRAMVGSFGPVNLKSGDYIKLDLAYVWERNTTDAYAGICNLAASIDSVTSFYKTYVTSVAAPQAPAFGIYPNPANQKITITLSSPAYVATIAQIFDMQGRLVAQSRITEETTEISAQNLSQGIYTVKISANGHTAVQKLVITR